MRACTLEACRAAAREDAHKVLWQRACDGSDLPWSQGMLQVCMVTSWREAQQGPQPLSGTGAQASSPSALQACQPRLQPGAACGGLRL